MLDITIIGNGSTGQGLASLCCEAGLNVLLVDTDKDFKTELSYERVYGTGVIAHTGMVHILNPDTGDEVRIVESKVIVFAPDTVPTISYSRMSGVTKFGVRITSDGKIEVGADGKTNAERIYATGPWASRETPGILETLRNLCKAAEAMKERV